MENATDSQAAEAANALVDDVHLSDQLHEQMGELVLEAIHMSDEVRLEDDISLTPEQEGVLTRAVVAGGLERLSELDEGDF